MKKRLQKKTIIGSFLGLTMLGDLAQAHQFTQTELALNMEKPFQAIMIMTSSPLNAEDKEVIYAGGIDSIVYAGDLRYYLYGNTKRMKSVLSSIDKIESISAIGAEQKASSFLNKQDQLGTLSVGASMHLNLLLFKEMSKTELQNYFEGAGIDASVFEVNSLLKSAKIRIASDDYEKVKGLSLVHYVDRSHSLAINSEKISRNAKTTKYSHVAPLWSGAYHLNGEGMNVAVIDGGLVRNTHQEFMKAGQSGVVLENGGGSFAEHATHVAGTIVADGDNAKAKGMASEATLYSYTFASSSFAEAALNIYNKDSVLISNHSYGYSEKIKLGVYDSEASKQDRAVSQNPYLNIFEAAGNDGEDSTYPAYGKIKGPANSKNILTIGALNTNSSGVATFSSNGPSKDGRIKPELCVRGESVYSAGSGADDDYFWMSGTSMATPAATGIGVLVSQAYQKVSGGYDIRHDVLKATLINTAEDKGRVGPDFDSGFGMIDAKAAVDTIRTLSTANPLIYTDKISHGAVQRVAFKMPVSGTFKATLSWIDPEASPSSAKALVNDIDMWLENSAGKKFYPFTLDGSKPTSLAQADKLNHVDNNEQIEVKSLPAGAYTLVIQGGEIIEGPQEYVVVSNVSISKKNRLEAVAESQLHNFAKVMQTALK